MGGNKGQNESMPPAQEENYMNGRRSVFWRLAKWFISQPKAEENATPRPGCDRVVSTSGRYEMERVACEEVPGRLLSCY